MVLLSATSLAPGFPLPRTVSVPSVFLAGSYLDRRIDENEEYRTPSGSPQVTRPSPFPMVPRTGGSLGGPRLGSRGRSSSVELVYINDAL